MTAEEVLKLLQALWWVFPLAYALVGWFVLGAAFVRYRPRIDDPALALACFIFLTLTWPALLGCLIFEVREERFGLPGGKG